MLLSSGAEKRKMETVSTCDSLPQTKRTVRHYQLHKFTILTSRQEIPSSSFSLILMLNLKIILLEAKSEMFSVIDETATERNRRKSESKWTVCNITVNFRPRALITIILRLQHQI